MHIFGLLIAIMFAVIFNVLIANDVEVKALEKRIEDLENLLDQKKE